MTTMIKTQYYPWSNFSPWLVGPFFLLILLTGLFVMIQKELSHSKTADSSDRNAISYGKLPLSFEPNEGQADPSVQYLCRGRGYSLYLTGSEGVFVLQKGLAPSPREKMGFSKPHPVESSDVLRLKLKGASGSVSYEGEEKLPGISNYFIGNDPKKWHANIPQFAKVKVRGVYPGVDMVYYGHQGKLEYDFEVAPGVDPRVIRVSYEGGTKTQVDGNGNLRMDLRGNEVVFQAPVVYQRGWFGHRKLVEACYEPGGENQWAFHVGAYDKTKALVIDPTLVYSTYIGGTVQDVATCVVVDSSGNIYLSGNAGAGFPVKSAYQSTNAGVDDVFIAKINPAGGGASDLIYSTFIGGSNNEQATAIALDSANEAYVTGYTDSTNFPTTGGAFQTTFGGGSYDSFVAKLSASGSALLYSTYLGGTGYDIGDSIAVDSSGKAYLTGDTAGAFPTTSGAFHTVYGGGTVDGFMAILNPAGGGASDLVYSTYLGGSAQTQGLALALNSGHVYVAGYTQGTISTTSGAYQTALEGSNDAFLTILNPAGGGTSDLVYSTYLGGNSNSQANAIAVDGSGAVYLAGNAASGFPTTSGAYQTTFGGLVDAIVIKMVPAGTGASDLVYATYLGGPSYDFGLGIAVDPAGNIFVGGESEGANYPTTSGAYQTTYGGTSGTGYNAFLSEVHPGGAGISDLVYSTYFSGSGHSDTYVYGIALDSSENIYLAGSANDNFLPTTSGAFQTTFGGTLDGFTAKFSFPIPAVTLTPTFSPTLTPTSTPSPTPTPTPNSVACCAVTWAQIFGTLSSARGIAIDYARNAGYVADNNTIRAFNLSTGVLTGTVGAVGAWGNPQGIWVGTDTNLYVADDSTDMFIQKVDPPTGTVLATIGAGQGLGAVRGVYEDPNGDLYIASGANTGTNTLFRYVFTPPNIYTGFVLSLAVTLNTPTGVARSGNNLFVADSLDNRVVMLKESVTGSNNYDQATILGGSSFAINTPQELTKDLAGNIYAADYGNEGYIVWGPNGNFLFNCQQSFYNQPFGIGVDTTGNVYLADALSNAVMKVSGGCLAEPAYVVPTPTVLATSSPTPTPISPAYNQAGPGQTFLYPSPASGPTATVAYYMKQPGTVKIRVWNAAAEFAAQLMDEKGQGPQTSTLSLSHYVAGVYLYKLQIQYVDGESEDYPLKQFAVIR